MPVRYLWVTYARFTCMSFFECFSVTVSAIYCLNPKLRLCFVQNWVLLYINENENRSALPIRSDKFTFLCLSFRHLVQNKQIVKVLWISTHQTLLRGKTRRFQGFFMKVIEYRIAKIFIIVVDDCIITIHKVITCDSTLMKQSLTVRVLSKCNKFLLLKRKEPLLRH